MSLKYIPYVLPNFKISLEILSHDLSSDVALCISPNFFFKISLEISFHDLSSDVALYISSIFLIIIRLLILTSLVNSSSCKILTFRVAIVVISHRSVVGLMIYLCMVLI